MEEGKRMRIVYVLATPRTGAYWAGDYDNWYTFDPFDAQWYTSFDDIRADEILTQCLAEGIKLRVETLIM
jgi:hypothetical protein